MSETVVTCRLASRAQIARWSTMSRNEVAPFLAGLNIDPLRRGYPWSRVYNGMLGVRSTTAAEAALLAKGLVRLGRVADRLGITPDTLLRDVREGQAGFPPLYVFGDRRHLFLAGQIDEMISSPRNRFPALTRIEGYAVPRADLPAALGTSRRKVDALLSRDLPPPAQLIVEGRVHFVVADIAHRIAQGAPATASACRGSGACARRDRRCPRRRGASRRRSRPRLMRPRHAILARRPQRRVPARHGVRGETVGNTRDS